MRFAFVALLLPLSSLAITFTEDTTVAEDLVLTEDLDAEGSLTTNGRVDGNFNIEVAESFTANSDIGRNRPVAAIDAAEDFTITAPLLRATGDVDVEGTTVFDTTEFSGTASSWDFAGPVVFAQPGTITLSTASSGGDIDFESTITGPTTGTVIIRTYTPSGSVDFSGTLPANVSFETLNDSPPLPTDSDTRSLAPLTNVSMRTTLAPGEVVQPGFVVGGENPRRVLVRAIGPTLSAFDVTTPLVDPELQILQDGEVIAENDDWEDVDTSAFVAVGAFALLGSSQDAAILTTLNPGIYNIVVRNDSDSVGGEVLVEIYFVD